MLVKGDKFATLKGGKRLVDQGLRPCQIVTLFQFALGNALVDKLSRRLFNRGKIPVATWA